jgi:ribonucleotide monophosphatase NagD (HAD superfamily)
MRNPPPTTFPDNLAALMPRYDGFLLDQWGVLHDGVRPYPGAVRRAGDAAAGGKRVIILSNSGRSGVETPSN